MNAYVIAGVILLLLLAADVFLTVFQSQGRGGPLNRRQNRLVWQVFRLVGVRGLGKVHGAWLNLAAPTMAVLTVFVWVLLLVAGFALIYYPWILTFLASPGSLRTPWIEALYYSGYTAATLGFGDVVPDREWIRLLAPLQAFGGFALLTVSITYLLAIYQELLVMQTLARGIAAYAEANPSVIARLGDAEGGGAASSWSEQVAEQVLHTLQAHYQYPILHYFRPVDGGQALPVQLGVLLDPLSRAGPAVPHPSACLLKESLRLYVREVDTHFVPQRGQGREEPQGDAEETRHAHERLLRYMGYRT